jgi:serpin B
MRTKEFVLFLALLTGIAACKKEEQTPNLIPKQITLTASAPEVIDSNNAFGIELFTKVALEEDGNIMLSPLSASIALTMVLNGSGGNTYAQLKETLKYPEDLEIADINEAYKSLVKQLLEADPKVKIAIANALFYRLGFDIKAAYLATMSNDFDAQIQGLDFDHPSALTTINQWANDNTFGKIPKVLDEISGNAVMFLMNALYFKGDWSYQFDKTQTEPRPFYLSSGSSIDVSTMLGEVGAKIVYGSDYKVLEMPYGRTNFTMVVVVPNENLNDFYAGFNAEVWSEITNSIDNYPDFSTTVVYMPKFSFSFETQLKDHLIAMGMIDAFTPFIADFSGITDSPIFVSFVQQNTFVDVNEEGTEAAAVTTVGFAFTSVGPNEPPVFTIDKPFIFLLRERTTNTLMFIGKIENPLQ